jgi:hypothetical protein
MFYLSKTVLFKYSVKNYSNIEYFSKKKLIKIWPSLDFQVTVFKNCLLQEQSPKCRVLRRNWLCVQGLGHARLPHGPAL